MGISFSGGLSIVAAGRPALRDRVAYVLSFGGHADLPRVLRYLCTGVEQPPPGSGSALRSAPAQAGADDCSGIVEQDSLAPPPRRTTTAWRCCCSASPIASCRRPGRAAARRRAALPGRVGARSGGQARAAAGVRRAPRDRQEAAGAVGDAARLRERSRRRAPRRAPAAARRTLRRRSGAVAGASADKPTAPVFLLHGIADNVIPAAESVHLSAALRGIAPVRLLLTGLISHAEADRPARFRDVMKLASFWGDLLNR